MSVASITDLSTRRPQSEPVGEEREEWSLPPGAKPVDGVAFGEMDRTIKRLAQQVAVLERRLSVLAERLASKEDQ